MNDCFWSIYGGDLMTMLVRAHGGEDPEMVYLEFYANCEHEYPEGDA